MCALPLTDRTNDRLSLQILDLNFARSQSQQSNRYDSGILMIGTINFCMQNCERTRMNKTCLTSATLTFLCVLLVIYIYEEINKVEVFIFVFDLKRARYKVVVARDVIGMESSVALMFHCLVLYTFIKNI